MIKPGEAYQHRTARVVAYIFLITDKWVFYFKEQDGQLQKARCPVELIDKALLDGERVEWDEAMEQFVPMRESVQ